MWIAIAIPATVIPIIIFFFVFFRKNIAALIDRTKMVKFPGTEIQATAPTQKPVETKPDETEKLMNALESPALKATEDEIRKDLENRGTVDKEKVLIRYLAVASLSILFERINALIWGSQIYILEHLNTIRTGVNKDEIKRLFYDDAITRYPLYYVGYSYEAYLRFLKASQLIIEENEILKITNLGVEFLRYLAETGRSTARFRPG
jgi:hypothetical protein